MNYAQEIVNLAKAQKLEQDLRNTYAAPLMTIQAAHNAAKTLEEKIRSTALMDFMESGEKPQHEAISVKQVAQKCYNTPENLKICIESHPEFLSVDPESFCANAAAITQAMSDIRAAQDLSLAGTAAYRGIVLSQLIAKTFVVNEAALKAAVSDGLAPWANFTESRKPTIFLSSKLGQWSE